MISFNCYLPITSKYKSKLLYSIQVNIYIKPDSNKGPEESSEKWGRFAENALKLLICKHLINIIRAKEFEQAGAELYQAHAKFD